MAKKIALVFGGSRGIGAATVAALERDGFDVGLHLCQPTAETGRRRQGLQGRHPRRRREVAQVFADVEKRSRRGPDCVVANAGINVPPAPVGQFDPENFRKLVEVNIVGAFNILQRGGATRAGRRHDHRFDDLDRAHRRAGRRPLQRDEGRRRSAWSVPCRRSLPAEASASMRVAPGPGRYRPLPCRQERGGAQTLGRP